MAIDSTKLTPVGQINFEYTLDLKYNYFCNGCYGCEEGDDYCRGAVYEDFSLPSVNLTSIAERVFQVQYHTVASDTEVKALVELIKRDGELLGALEEIDSWDIRISGGYYGQEMDAVNLCSPYSGQLQDLRDLVVKLGPERALEPDRPESHTDGLGRTFL